MKTNLVLPGRKATPVDNLLLEELLNHFEEHAVKADATLIIASCKFTLDNVNTYDEFCEVIETQYMRILLNKSIKERVAARDKTAVAAH